MWVCPVCRSRLSRFEEGVRCDRGHIFSTRAGLPVLVTPEEVSLLADAESYSKAWVSTAWAPSPEELELLPYGTRGKTRAFWEPKARSLETLLRILGPAAGRTVVDAGAGTGWLSHQLSQRGFRCLATDISDDARVGLGAAAVFDRTGHGFNRAIASLTRWPIADGSADVAVFNASLHYLSDVAPALREARRVLRPGCRLFVLNSPVHRKGRSASRAAGDFRNSLRALGARGSLVEGHRHFVATDFERELRAVFSDVRRHDPRFGPRFRLARALKGLVLRMELASFPIYEAVTA